METLLETFYKEFQDFRKEVRETNKSFVSVVKHQNDLEELKGAIARQTTRIEKMEKSRGAQNTLSAILGAVLAFLINYFVTNVGS